MVLNPRRLGLIRVSPGEARSQQRISRGSASATRKKKTISYILKITMMRLIALTMEYGMCRGLEDTEFSLEVITERSFGL